MERPRATHDFPPFFGVVLIEKITVCMAIFPTKSVFSTVFSINSTFEFSNHSLATFSTASLPIITLFPPKYFITLGLCNCATKTASPFSKAFLIAAVALSNDCLSAIESVMSCV